MLSFRSQFLRTSPKCKSKIPIQYGQSVIFTLTKFSKQTLSKIAEVELILLPFLESNSGVPSYCFDFFLEIYESQTHKRGILSENLAGLF